MTTVPAETLDTLDAREHTRRTASGVVSRFHQAIGFDDAVVEDARTPQRRPTEGEGRDVTSQEQAQHRTHATTDEEEQ